LPRPPPDGGSLPLIAAATIAFAAGLLLGFGGAIVGGVLVAIVVGVAALARRDAALAAIALVSAAGLLIARNRESVGDDCRTMLAGTREWVAELEDAAAPGAYIRGRVRVGQCEMPASLSIERGAAPAGARVRVTGEPLPGERGLLVRRATLSAPAPGGLLARWRAAARRAIDRTFGPDAPLARALLVADSRGIPIDVRDRYAAAGVVHLLSISGLHVAIIASAAQLLFGLVRFPPRAAAVAAVITTGIYVAVIGAPAPAVRSAVMLGVTALSRLAQRPTSPWASLALGALMPLVEPETILDLGYQLSVAGMAAIIASGAFGRRVIASRFDGWRRWLATNLATSIIASLVTAPLCAWTFGQVSVVAPLTNLVATPILTLAQPMLFLALLLAPLPPLALFIADAVRPVLALFDLVARLGAAVPYGAIAVAPTLVSSVLAGAIGTAIVVACVSRFPMRPVIVAVSSLAMLLWSPAIEARHGEFELHMIDVGQGDALAVRTPGNRWVVVDAGRSWRGGDAARANVVPHLRRRGGEVDAFVLSHPHDDHVGGAATVLQVLRPRAYWDAAYPGTSDAYRLSLLTARGRGIAWRRVHPGDSLMIDGVVFTILAPDSAWTASLRDPNEASTIVLIRYGERRFLLTGDAESAEEAWVVASAADLRADVLKVAHHGSPTSTTPAFLAAVRPRVALISVGAGNRYGHPGARVLADLAAVGALVMRTDRSGSIVVRSDGRSLVVDAEGESWILSTGSSPR
jgi:competence protein ComEC